LLPSVGCGKIDWEGGEVPHTYIGVTVTANPNWDGAETAVREAAQEHGCGEPNFDREPPDKLHSRIHFDELQQAREKLGPLRASVERRGFRVFDSRVEDD
jgi:hypothetical protein